jgi:transcription elongation factor GreA
MFYAPDVDIPGMQIPKRKSEEARRLAAKNEPLYLTTDGIQKLKDELKNLEKALPNAIAETQRTGQFGDFSENAEYQIAKGNLRRINHEILVINDKLKRAKIIKEKNSSGIIQIGSTVIFKLDGKQKKYQIVGPAETDPTRGRVSHLSPIGSAIMGHRAGDNISANGKNIEIIEVM